MSSRLLLAIFLGAIFGLAGGLITYWPSHLFFSKSASVAIGGPFTLVNVTGQERTEKDFLGKPMLIFFGFTNCPDICPSGLQTLTVSLNKLGQASQKISLVFVTIDPERDTPQVLKTYLANFHTNIEGLTGSNQQVEQIVKVYRVYTKKIPDTMEPKRYYFDHSSFFYLMDGAGKYVKHFPSSITAEALSAELSSYLSNVKIKE